MVGAILLHSLRYLRRHPAGPRTDMNRATGTALTLCMMSRAAVLGVASATPPFVPTLSQSQTDSRSGALRVIQPQITARLRREA